MCDVLCRAGGSAGCGLRGSPAGRPPHGPGPPQGLPQAGRQGGTGGRDGELHNLNFNV